MTVLGAASLRSVGLGCTVAVVRMAQHDLSITISVSSSKLNSFSSPVQTYWYKRQLLGQLSAATWAHYSLPDSANPVELWLFCLTA